MQQISTILAILDLRTGDDINRLSCFCCLRNCLIFWAYSHFYTTHACTRCQATARYHS